MAVKTEAKMLLSTLSFFSSVFTSLPVLLIRSGTVSLTFLFWLTYQTFPFVLQVSFYVLYFHFISIHNCACTHSHFSETVILTSGSRPKKHSSVLNLIKINGILLTHWKKHVFKLLPRSSA